MIHTLVYNYLTIIWYFKYSLLNSCVKFVPRFLLCASRNNLALELSFHYMKLFLARQLILASLESSRIQCIF